MNASQADALIQLKRLVAHDVYPTLTDGELLDLLEQHRRASAWEASSDIAFGQSATTSGAAGNGRTYRCIQAGTTGASEPAWPSAACAMAGQRIKDGSVLWQDAGPAHPKVYDVRAAAKAAWLRKAAKASADVTISAGGQKLDYGAIVTNCERMAAKYGRVGIG